jgi:hypothetical protein
MATEAVKTAGQHAYPEPRPPALHHERDATMTSRATSAVGDGLMRETAAVSASYEKVRTSWGRLVVASLEFT